MEGLPQQEAYRHINMHDIPALSLDDSPPLRWALDEIWKTMDPSKIEKRQLVLLQSPATYYAGMAVRQKGNMKRAEILRLAADIMRENAAPGFLKFIENLGAVKLPADLNVSMMGRTRLSGETFWYCCKKWRSGVIFSSSTALAIL